VRILVFSILLIACAKIQASLVCSASGIGSCKSPAAAYMCIANDDKPLFNQLLKLKEKRLLVISPAEKCLKALRTGSVNPADNVIQFNNIKHPNCYANLHKCIFDPASKTFTPLNSQNSSSPFMGALNRWMGSPHINTVPFNQLVLPGAHDALTSSINSNREFSPDAPAFMTKLHGPLKAIVSNWARAQSYSAGQLLNLGVRYMDVRVANRNGEFWTIHSLYGEPFESSLLQVRNFLDENPQEIIVIDIQNLESSAQDRHLDGVDLDELISQILFSNTAPAETVEGFELVAHHAAGIDSSKAARSTATTNDITQTVKDIQDKGVRVFIFVRKEQLPNLIFDNQGVARGAHQINYIDRSYLESRWHNVADKLLMETKIFTQLAERELDAQRHNKLLVLQVQPTPATEEIVRGLMPIPGVRSLEDLARKWNKDPGFMNSCEHFVRQSNGAVIMLDFMDEETSRMIIGFNHRRNADLPIPG
jgi:hypothetical protein